MSCAWYVYCEDCDKEHEVGNHMLDEARSLIEHRHAIAAMAPLTHRVTIGLLRDLYVSTAWFAEHKDHRLVPRNEYRQCDGDCGAYYFCKECGGRRSCSLPKDHETDTHGQRPKKMP